MPYPGYFLVYSQNLTGSGSVTKDPLNIQLQFPVKVYAISQSSTSTNYLFNFQLAGQDFPFFAVNQASAIGVNMSAIWPANVLKPIRLGGEILLKPSDRLLISLTDKSGSTNDIQIVFWCKAEV